MKRLVAIFAAALGCVLLFPALQAGEGTVTLPARRLEALRDAKALLTPRESQAAIKDPFHSQPFMEALAANSGKGLPTATAVEGTPRTGAQRNARELLQAIANSLKPSGFFVLSGQPTLVFGQKRVKAGSALTITFEGSEYTLEIVSIERPNFTLRLNQEEYTRPIK